MPIAYSTSSESRISKLLESKHMLNRPMRLRQSNLSQNPPCPGKVSAKSLILYPRLNPLAKKPAKGPIRDIKMHINTAAKYAGVDDQV